MLQPKWLLANERSLSIQKSSGLNFKQLCTPLLFDLSNLYCGKTANLVAKFSTPYTTTSLFLLLFFQPERIVTISVIMASMSTSFGLKKDKCPIRHCYDVAVVLLPFTNRFILTYYIKLFLKLVRSVSVERAERDGESETFTQVYIILAYDDHRVERYIIRKAILAVHLLSSPA